MEENIDGTMKQLETTRRVSRNNVEYWFAREIQAILGYSTWEGFVPAITRAMAACAASGEEVKNHFRETTKMVQIGSSTQRRVSDYYLDRYGCYLIAMNGNPQKPEIAAAQTYFAIQTRLQEIGDENLLLEKRFELRSRVTTAVKSLNSAAKQAGVQNYALFHDAGYRGLYGLPLPEIKKRKGISEKEELFDRAGRAELAANEFRITQAEQKIVRDNIKGQQSAMDAHKQVGQEVRVAIGKIGGTMPENLQPEPSLKLLAKEKEKTKLATPKP